MIVFKVCEEKLSNNHLNKDWANIIANCTNKTTCPYFFFQNIHNRILMNRKIDKKEWSLLATYFFFAL